MTSSPPAEPQYFRGKSLTPESPVPVHIPEPRNIPVLQNQIDPIFNLVSTHMENALQRGDAIPSQPYSSQQPPTLQDPSDSLDERKEGIENDVQTPSAVPNIPGVHFQASNLPETSGNQPSYDAQKPIFSGVTENPPPFPRNENPGSVLSPTSEQPTGAIHPQSHSNPTSRDSAPDTNALTPIQQSGTDVDDADVNYQALLDSLTPSVTVPPSNDSTNATATQALTSAQASSNAPTPIATLPVPAGLPARPPPQEKPSIHPNYNADEDIRSYHNPPAQNGSTPANGQANATPLYPAPNVAAQAGMSPPVPTAFQQVPLSSPPLQNLPQTSPNIPKSDDENNAIAPGTRFPERSTEQSSAPELEATYQEFLREEARYTSQGQWERFPPGSRLFIGNLFTEKVTKKDLFNIFHKYGNLAQISMKSAYGFIQYVQAADCHTAMQREQGLELKGRKINLEISKPQKNTRGGGGGGDRGNHGRRSRSPDHRRGGNRGQNSRAGNDRADRAQNSNEFQLRGRDDYRPGRSPSPRGFRAHDSYRGGRDRSADRYYGGRRSRSRSPYGVGSLYRERSPKGRDVDDEATLPIPRRPPGSAPDVEIILAEEVDRTFIGYIQQPFRERGLRSEILQLPPRVSVSAVVKRQILEGVLAVVKIFRRSQVTGKIPLQVFNRSQGYNNVQFDEYEDLDANVAAEVVVRAKSTHAAPPQMRQPYPPAQTHASPPQFNPNVQPMQNHHGLGQPMHSAAPPPHHSQIGGPPPNISNLITSLDGPSLHKLLSSITPNQQSPQTPIHSQAAPQSVQTPDLSALLSSVASHQMKPQGGHQPPYGQQGPPHSNYPSYGSNVHPQYQQGNGPPANAALQGNPALSQLLMHSHNRPSQPGMASPTSQQQQQQHQQHQQQQQQQHPQQQSVQDIMAQLARYR